MLLMGRSDEPGEGGVGRGAGCGGIVEAVEARGGRQGGTATDAGLLWIVVGVWVATVVLVVMALVLLAKNGPAPSFGRIAAAHGQRAIAAAAGALCTLAFATVGATIVWHRRRQVVGWLFCLGGVALAVQAFAAFYATHALVASPGSLRGGQVLGWLGTWVSAPALLLIPLFCFLLFPDGRLPSRRWRLVAWLDGLILAMATVGVAVRPGPLAVLPSVANPFGASGMAARLAGWWPRPRCCCPSPWRHRSGRRSSVCAVPEGHSASSSSGSPARRPWWLSSPFPCCPRRPSPRPGGPTPAWWC